MTMLYCYYGDVILLLWYIIAVRNVIFNPRRTRAFCAADSKRVALVLRVLMSNESINEYNKKPYYNCVIRYTIHNTHRYIVDTKTTARKYSPRTL